MFLLWFFLMGYNRMVKMGALFGAQFSPSLHPDGRMLHEGVVPEDLAYDAAMSSLRSKWRAALECCDRRGSTHAESVVFVIGPSF